MAGGGTRKLSSTQSTNKLCLRDLDADLLLEILLRLPTAKHALICSSVCKEWYRLILSNFFIGRFVSYHIDQDVNYNCNIAIDDPDSSHGALLLLQNPNFQIEKLDLSSLCEGSEWATIMSSCHDLVLCVANMGEEEGFRYFICNFLTKQKIALPVPAKWLKDLPSYEDINCAFICKPYCATDTQGRFTQSTGCRYMVLQFRRDVQSDAWGLPVEMYCSETRQWSSFCLVDKGLQEVVHTNLVWYKEKLHWSTTTHIVAFDPFNIRDVCFSVKHPTIRGCSEHEEAMFRNAFYAIGVCRGFFRFMEMGYGSWRDEEDPDMTSAYLRLWDLEDYENKKWGLERMVCIYKLAEKNDAILRIFLNSNIVELRILQTHPFDEDVVFLSLDDTIVSCNIKTEELKVIAEFRGVKLLPYSDYETAGKLITIPWWPTPISPIIQNSPVLEKQTNGDNAFPV